MEAIVKARVNAADKEEAAAVLKALGLSLSDLLRMAIVATARDGAVPFKVGLSEENLATIREIEAGGARRVSRLVDFELPARAPGSRVKSGRAA